MDYSFSTRSKMVLEAEWVKKICVPRSQQQSSKTKICSTSGNVIYTCSQNSLTLTANEFCTQLMTPIKDET
ncbi:hypothetical protein CRENBAI_010944 [Crenichthys baileyi]|uniref:Uncharacterized protein n=1 Tax=Crenichthys baileyi TaxID=28760 RepID=A0AAV9R0Z0_9TELE